MKLSKISVHPSFDHIIRSGKKPYLMADGFRVQRSKNVRDKSLGYGTG